MLQAIGLDISERDPHSAFAEDLPDRGYFLLQIRDKQLDFPPHGEPSKVRKGRGP